MRTDGIHAKIFNLSTEVLMCVAAFSLIPFSEETIFTAALVYFVMLFISLMTYSLSTKDTLIQSTHRTSTFIAAMLIWFAIIFFMSSAASIELHIPVDWQTVFSVGTIVSVLITVFSIAKLRYEKRRNLFVLAGKEESHKTFFSLVIAFLLFFVSISLITKIGILFSALIVFELVIIIFTLYQNRAT